MSEKFADMMESDQMNKVKFVGRKIARAFFLIGSMICQALFLVVCGAGWAVCQGGYRLLTWAERINLKQKSQDAFLKLFGRMQELIDKIKALSCDEWKSVFCCSGCGTSETVDIYSEEK